ncbi:hypothetical protein KKF61_09185 [Patescibacteria group bacterium]|nr:hypothetical protein [Patescibacteria group bacterium]
MTYHQWLVGMLACGLATDQTTLFEDIPRFAIKAADEIIAQLNAREAGDKTTREC